MLSIEEIKLLIEKLEKAKKQDLELLVDNSLATLKQIAKSIDAYNENVIDRLDKTPEWFYQDLKFKRKIPPVDAVTRKQIQSKIFQFSRTNIYHSLEIGPGNGMFSMDFRAWKGNFFLDVLPWCEKPIRSMFPNRHQKYLKFFLTKDTSCANIPQASCNFVFSWDTFVFFTQNHIRQYLHDINRVMIPGAYAFIHYADCHYDYDLQKAKTGYWNYNTKASMEKIIQDEGYKIIEMNQMKPGANYAIFQKPGKQNPVSYNISEITLD